MRGRLPKTGQYTGDGTNAAIVNVGFRPVKVEIYNVTDGDLAVILLDDGSEGIHLELKDSGAGTTDLAKITSNKAKIGPRGFTSGTDADVIESAKVFRWIAY